MKNNLENIPISIFEMQELKNLVEQCKELLCKGQGALQANPHDDSIKYRTLILETTVGLNEFLVNNFTKNYKLYTTMIEHKLLRKDYQDVYKTLKAVLEAYDGNKFLNE